MKKIAAMLLLVFLALCLLVGCNLTEKYYSVNVTGSKDSLIYPLSPSYKAGSVVRIKAHPITDISLYVFVNGEQIPMSHFDSDYWGFEFVMPEENVTVHLTYDRFYGKDEYTLDELCSGLSHLESGFTTVSIKTIDYSEKYSLIETRYSSDPADIESFKEILGKRLVRADNNIASEARYGREYGFYYNIESHGERKEVLRFNDSFFTWNDFSSWQAFSFEDEQYALPAIENPDRITYSFKYDHQSSDVRKYDDESFSIDYFDIGEVEFIPYENEGLEANARFYLDSGYGRINLLTPTVFELNGDYYEIVFGEQYWAYSYCKLGGVN